MARKPFPARDSYAIDDRIDRFCDRRFTRWEWPAAYRASPLVRFEPFGELVTSAPDINGQFWPVVAVSGRPLDRISVWLTDLPKQGQDPLPPQFRMQLRVGFNAFGEAGASEIASVRVNALVTPPSWDAKDLLFQFSGVVGTQWELWAGVVPGGGAGGASVPLQPWLSLTVDAAGCCDTSTITGPFVVIA